MRTFCLAASVALVVFFLSSPAFGDEKAESKLIGTWKLVSAKYGGKENALPTAMTTIKHITPAQMMWLTYGADGIVTRAGGGSYTLQGDDFTDTPEYGVGQSFQAVKGRTHKFKCRVEGNKWYHTGMLDSGLTIEEVWERIEK